MAQEITHSTEDQEARQKLLFASWWNLHNTVGKRVIRTKEEKGIVIRFIFVVKRCAFISYSLSSSGRHWLQQRIETVDGSLQ